VPSDFVPGLNCRLCGNLYRVNRQSCTTQSERLSLRRREENGQSVF
jgi:hypothetical protein